MLSLLTVFPCRDCGCNCNWSQGMGPTLGGPKSFPTKTVLQHVSRLTCTCREPKLRVRPGGTAVRASARTDAAARLVASQCHTLTTCLPCASRRPAVRRPGCPAPFSIFCRQSTESQWSSPMCSTCTRNGAVEETRDPVGSFVDGSVRRRVLASHRPSPPAVEGAESKSVATALSATSLSSSRMLMARR